MHSTLFDAADPAQERQPTDEAIATAKPGGAVTTLCLVGCSKTKLAHAAPAKDLYCSPLFFLSRRWAERNANAWAILSAHYGVVKPDAVISPYDTRVTDRRPFGQPRLRPKEFDSWFYGSVQTWYCQFVKPGQSIRLIVLAGKDYWCELANRRISVPFTAPLDGMGIGARMRWLRQELA